MVHAYIDSGQYDAAYKCEEIDLGGGNFSYRAVTPPIKDAPILAKMPNGGWRWDAEEHIGKPWQTYRKNEAGTALFCDREDHGAWTYFVVPATFVTVEG